HFHHQSRSEDAVFAKNVAANGQSAGRFASQQRIMLHHSGDDVLEPYRDFIAFLVQGVRQPVQQVGGGQIAHDAAAFAANLMDIPVEQQQDVVDGYVLAQFIHNRDAVGVPIHGQAEIVMVIVHRGGQQPQRLRVGRRRTAAKQRIVALVNERHTAARFGQDRAQRELPNTVHGIHDHLEAGIANGLKIDQGLHGVHVLVGEVAPLYDAGVQRHVQLQLDDFVGGERVGLGLDLLCFMVQQPRPIAAEYLQAVPFRRVVAGGEGHFVGGAPVGGGVRDQRGGRILGQQDGGDIVAGKNLGRGFGGLPGKETAVIAHDHAALFLAPPGDFVGQRLAQPANVVHRKAFADDGAPAAGAEGDQVLLFLSSGKEKPFLEDELGGGQVLRRVDALDLILVVQLIAIHAETRADEFVYAVGETVLTVARGGRKPAQGGEDGCRIHHVSSDVQLANLAHFRQRLVFFDDVQDLAAGIADDAAVRQRAIQHGRQQRKVRLLEMVPVDQTANRARAEKRRVAVKDQQIAAEILQKGRRLQDRVSGAERLFLADVAIAGAQALPHFLLPVSDHHIQVLDRYQLQRILNHVLQHAAVAEGLQNQRTPIRCDRV